jgi:hypothetical protein
VAVSSVATAYSLAATIGFLFGAVAYAGPAVIIVSFVPMLPHCRCLLLPEPEGPELWRLYAWISRWPALTLAGSTMGPARRCGWVPVSRPEHLHPERVMSAAGRRIEHRSILVNILERLVAGLTGK